MLVVLIKPQSPFFLFKTDNGFFFIASSLHHPIEKLPGSLRNQLVYSYESYESGVSLNTKAVNHP